MCCCWVEASKSGSCTIERIERCSSHVDVFDDSAGITSSRCEENSQVVVGFSDVYGLAIKCPGVGWVVLRSSAAKHHDFGLGHVKGVVSRDRVLPPLVRSPKFKLSFDNKFH